MKFHLIAGALAGLLITIVYYIFVGVQADFDEARSQIREEAVRTVQKKRSEHLNQKASEVAESKLDEKKVLNPAVFKSPPVQLASTKSDDRAPAPVDIMIERIGNDEYWCREGVEPRKETKPVRCYYSAACYGCTGSTVIPPDSQDVVPFCDNGRQSEIFSIECCPSSASGAEMECPSARECLHADAVPESYCSCNNRPDCRYVDIANQIQCVCIQN